MDAMRKMMRGVAGVAAETVWPTRCAVCDEPGELLCARCKRVLAPVDRCLACPVCGAPYGRTQCTECNDLMMGAVGRERPPFATMSFALVADESARRIVRAYKDGGERRLGALIADACAHQVSPDRTREGCAVTFIPSTRDAQRRRGFDHAREAAALIAERIGADCLGLLLPPRTYDQRQLSRRERIGNMSGTLRVVEGAPVPERLIVFDDICTTGSTLYAAADALAAAGARELHALAFGRVLD